MEKGEVIVDGALNPHDILRLRGISSVANYIINEYENAVCRDPLKKFDSKMGEYSEFSQIVTEYREKLAGHLGIV